MPDSSQERLPDEPRERLSDQPRERLPDEPCTPSGASNSDITLIVHADTHRTPPMLEGLGPEAAKQRIDELAKVTQPVISPSHSHHTSALGART